MMRLPATLAVIAPLTMAAAAPAQVQQRTHTGPQPRFQGVEQMVEDISPLAVSLRSFQSDLRQPSGFESVYRLPGEADGQDRLMRIDGALTATFLQSVYAPLYVRERFMLFFSRERKIGYVPQVPPGTVFRIGLPEIGLQWKPGRSLSQPETLVAAEPAARRVEVKSLAELHAQDESSPPAARSMRGSDRIAMRTGEPESGIDETGAPALSESNREQRMRELLRRAVNAERGGPRQ